MKSIFARPVTIQNFDDLTQLMEARGGPDFCWCMAFRAKPREDKTAPISERKAWRKALLQERVQAGEQIGLLAYNGQNPIGWVSTGPLSGFRMLGGPKPVRPDKIWTISCFFFPKAWRNQGLMRLLTERAIDLARQSGATEFRANPVKSDARSYHFQGAVPLFISLGFEQIGMAGNGRHIMRLPL